MLREEGEGNEEPDLSVTIETRTEGSSIANGGLEVFDMGETEATLSTRSASPVTSLDSRSEFMEETEMGKTLRELEAMDVMVTEELPEEMKVPRAESPSLQSDSDLTLPRTETETETESDSDDDETSGADASDEDSSSGVEKPSSSRRKAELDGFELRRKNPYRFSPDSFAIGVMDHTGKFSPGFHTPTIESSIAFDARKKAFLIDVIPTTPEPLPAAMELVDACIRVEDIIEGGVAIVATAHEDLIDVTMTITCRRPPQFFMPVLDEHMQPAYKDSRVVEATRAEFQRVSENVRGIQSTPFIDKESARGGFASLRRPPATHIRDEGTSGKTMLGTPESIYNRQRGESLRASHTRRRELQVPKEQIGFGRPHPSKPESGALLRWRRATEFDFSGSFNGWERDAGSINPDGDVRYKVNVGPIEMRVICPDALCPSGQLLGDIPPNFLPHAGRIPFAASMYAKAEIDWRRGRRKLYLVYNRSTSCSETADPARDAHSRTRDHDPSRDHFRDRLCQGFAICYPIPRRGSGLPRPGSVAPSRTHG